MSTRKAFMVGMVLVVVLLATIPPTSFVWRGQEYKIVEIERQHRRLDFERAWWSRRHRDYHRVKTDTGQVLEIYYHRGPGKRYWMLYREFMV